MKLKKNFTLAGLGDEYVAVPLDGDDSFRGIVKLNESGAEVFKGMSEGLGTDQIVRNLMDKYAGLDEETARKAVAIVVDEFKNAGLLEE